MTRVLTALLTVALCLCSFITLTSAVCDQKQKKKLEICVRLVGRANDLSVEIENDGNRLCEDIYKDVKNLYACKVYAAYLTQGTNWDAIRTTLKRQDYLDFCLEKLSQRPNFNHDCRREKSVTGIRCLFFHGVGQPDDDKRTLWNNRVQDGNKMFASLKDYWGEVHIELQKYCDVRFFWTDSKLRGWSNPSLQAEYCGAINSYKPHVIFTHSMGNMVIAAGIIRKLPGCDRITKRANGQVNADTPVVHWYGVQGPLEGSLGADYMKKACLGTITGKIGSSAGYCDGFHPAQAYLTLSTTYVNPHWQDVTWQIDDKGGNDRNAYPNLVKYPAVTCNSKEFANNAPRNVIDNCVTLKSAANQYMSGSLCGTMYNAMPGKYNKDSFKLWALNKLVIGSDWGFDESYQMHEEQNYIYGNDGMVDFASCRIDHAWYKEDPNWDFYAVKANHNEGRCKYPDVEGAGNLPFKPCLWYRRMARSSRRAFGLAESFPINILMETSSERKTSHHSHHSVVSSALLETNSFCDSQVLKSAIDVVAKFSLTDCTSKLIVPNVLENDVVNDQDLDSCPFEYCNRVLVGENRNCLGCCQAYISKLIKMYLVDSSKPLSIPTDQFSCPKIPFVVDPLPPNWIVIREVGLPEPYYYNLETGESTMSREVVISMSVAPLCSDKDREKGVPCRSNTPEKNVDEDDVNTENVVPEKIVTKKQFFRQKKSRVKKIRDE